jgi:predicted dehydrogenase
LTAAGVRWGIAGPGGIATRFVDALGTVAGGEAVAVGSRSFERAAAFAAQHGIARSHGSYAALADDDAVDAVYVAVPHSEHESLARHFLDAGKHVLCEKPMALNEDQVARMVAAATSNQRYLMEAIWSRFLPAYTTLSAILASGRIGEPQHVQAEFGFRMPVMPDHRLFDPALGGGALLDLGIYPLQLANLVLGPVESVSAAGRRGTTGVDELVVALTSHGGGKAATSTASIRLDLGGAARIVGDRGRVDLPTFMHDPRSLTVTTRDGSEEIACDYEGDGLRFQIAAVHADLAAGRLESTVVPLAESLALARTCDAVRAQLGVRYPADGA